MNFYEWFFEEKGRQPAGLFSLSHLLSVTIGLVLFLALAYFLGRKFKGDAKKQKITLIVSAIGIVLFQIFKIAYLLVGSTNVWDTIIGNAPLYFCDVMLYVIPVAAFSRGRVRDVCLDFIAICGLLMGFMGNYFAGNIYGSHAAISFLALNSLINHCISAFVALFVFVSGLNKMEKRNIPFVFGVLFFYMIIALICAYAFNKNFMFYFHGDGTPFTLFYDMVGGNLPIYQIIIFVLQHSYIGIFYSIYYPVANAVKKHRAVAA